MQLDHGWYCYYTDNNIKSKKTILAMHGAPGNHTQYAGIQTEMKGYCRWVNLIIPGMDGQDERRGSYDGSFSHFSQMVLKLLLKLQISKVILCCHSFSSSISPLLIKYYPDVFEGHISVAEIKHTWNLGLILPYQVVTLGQKYYNEQNNRVKHWEFEESRARMYERYLERCQNITLGHHLEMIKMRPSQFFAFFKLTNKSPLKMDEMIQLNKHLKILRVALDGKIDPYSDNRKTENAIINLVKGDSYRELPYFQKLFGLAKNPIEQRLLRQFEGLWREIEFRNIYVFCFEIQDMLYTKGDRRSVVRSQRYILPAQSKQTRLYPL